MVKYLDNIGLTIVKASNIVQNNSSSGETSIAEIIEQLNNSPSVEYAEPDFLVSTTKNWGHPD